MPARAKPAPVVIYRRHNSTRGGLPSAVSTTIADLLPSPRSIATTGYPLIASHTPSDASITKRTTCPSQYLSGPTTAFFLILSDLSSAFVHSASHTDLLSLSQHLPVHHSSTTSLLILELGFGRSPSLTVLQTDLETRSHCPGLRSALACLAVRHRRCP